MTPKLKLHVNVCVRCRHAKRIGRLCRKGKRLFDETLMELFPDLRGYHALNRLGKTVAALEAVKKDA